MEVLRSFQPFFSKRPRVSGDRAIPRRAVVSGLCAGFLLAYILVIPSRMWIRYQTISYLQSMPDGIHERHDALYHRADSGKGQGGKGQGGKPRVLCWIATQPANHEAKAKHVKATWGRRCDVLLFFSSRKDPSLPTVALNVTEGRQHLWEKTREAFRYIHRHHLLDADWFLKADDDTYVIVENLRRLLRDSDPSAPVYFGCRFKRFSGPGFMSGGAGYVLSKEALKRFVEKALPDAKACPLAKVKDEDVGMGRCLHAVGVEPGDSRDEKGRWRFLPYSPGSHLSPAPMWNADWVQCNAFHPYTQGRGCCSDRAVSFHYVSPESMHVLEYFIYRLRVDDRR